MGLERVIVLLDMDCFYVQVEQREKPELKGKPCAVVQYRKYKGGGIIAVSYEARDHGVKRGFMGDDAQRVCPEITLVRVPTQRDKAVLTKYRDAGAEVINVLMQFSKKVERASIDEAFIDLTDEVDACLADLPEGSLVPGMLPFTHVAGWEDRSGETDQGDRSKEDIRKAHLAQWLNGLESDADRRLAVGALITEQMRAAVLEQTEFNCSAGIAHNKMLAKMSCGLNKPRKQSVLPQHCIPTLFRNLPIGKIRGLGGKLGAAVTQGLGVVNMGDLVQYSEAELQAKVGPKAGYCECLLPLSSLANLIAVYASPMCLLTLGSQEADTLMTLPRVWLYSICRGIEDEPVRPRQLPKSVGCSKNFLGKSCLNTVEKVKFWIGQLSEEVSERLEKEEELNNRIAKSMSVHVRQIGKPMNGISRSCSLHAYDAETITRTAMSLIQGLNRAGSHQAAWSPPLVNLGVTTTKFVDVPQHRGDNTSLETYFNSQAASSTKTKPPCNISPKPTTSSTSKHGLESYFSKRTYPDSASREKDTNTEIPELISGGGCTQRNSDQITDHDNLIMNSELTCDGLERDSIVAESSSSSGLVEYFRKASGLVGGWAIAITGAEQSDKYSSGVKRTMPDLPTTSSHPMDGGLETAGDLTDIREPPMQEKANPTKKGFFRSKVTSSHEKTNLTETTCILTPIQDVTVAKETGHNGTTSCQEDNQVGEDVSNSHTPDELLLLPKESYDYVLCDQCRQQVSAWNLPEHLDFHVAQALQEKENGYLQPAASSGQGLSNKSDSKTGKRKASQLGSAPKKSKPDPSNKTLHTFFAQR